MIVFKVIIYFLIHLVFTFMIVVEVITYFFIHIVDEFFLLRLKGFNGSSINNGDLNGTGAVDSYMTISLALIALSSDSNLEKFLLTTIVSVVPFRALVLNIIPIWRRMSTKLMESVTVPVLIFPVITIVMIILNPSVGPIMIQHFNFG